MPSPFQNFAQSRSLRVTMRNPETGTVTPLKGWVGNNLRERKKQPYLTTFPYLHFTYSLPHFN
ncbi:hypothetical protein GAQ78_21145 [Bacteroides uniformis]|uniref:Uncharacterized protein n=4 Tax=Bacteroidaceae TaxID=815 RepID=A0A6A1IQB5_9BACE|nr:hypothetical protein F3D71_29915 [Bacteroides ovatus]KAA5211320.1 hypothetical protein F2Z28_21500 [Bacteroides finegoldii]KAA5252750.1 hypothetical protein F2Z43_25275 [Bacteroides faecis]KAA5379085.1 hypothetical protein F2Y44_21770 [Phocaeicola dorei]KAA5411768.1 hypothetical protein F2Y87_28620 [Bacteroides cellulosilyticus]KAB3850910.1 hypothetical protein GAS29_22330 [Phocaeicola vulgatus]KAB3901992.1 hypothetical protein GAS26_22770 [Bacteroides uniformis]KAB6430138.1 hypothetical 